jgi:hypothetical protein
MRRSLSATLSVAAQAIASLTFSTGRLRASRSASTGFFRHAFGRPVVALLVCYDFPATQMVSIGDRRSARTGVTSRLNHLKRGIQAFQLHTGVGGGEVPVGLGVVNVATHTPPELNPDERLNADMKHAIGTKVPVRSKSKLGTSPERVRAYFQDPRVKYAA